MAKIYSMTPEKTYLEGVRRLRLSVLRPYLESRGWERASDYRGVLAVFRKGTDSVHQLLVPIRPEFDDFDEQMGTLISRIAQSEGRSERAVLQDISAAQVDTLRFRVISSRASGGTLPLEHGISLLEGARRSLLAAACTILSPGRTYHPRMSFTPAEEFVEACELGQTEEGSFTVVVRCPLQYSDEVIMGGDIPFTRKATDALFGSVSALVGAIEQDRLDSVMHAQVPSVRITSNLCDALLKMQPDAGIAGVELSVTWASSLPNLTSSSNAVTIRSEMFPRISDVGKFLRNPSGTQAARFLARVDVLRGSEIDPQGRRYGEVTLSIILGEDDEIVRARAILDAQQYAFAVEAHMRNRYVVVTGIIDRSNRLSTVRDVTGFEITAEQLLTFSAPPTA